jgi:hypothetical protein
LVSLKNIFGKKEKEENTFQNIPVEKKSLIKKELSPVNEIRFKKKPK